MKGTIFTVRKNQEPVAITVVSSSAKIKMIDY